MLRQLAGSFAQIGSVMNGLRPLCASVFLMLGLAVFAACAAAAPVFPPGSRIGLEPPGDLKLSRKFLGFEDSARNVAITILDLPEPAYQALEKSAFTKMSKGLTVEKRELFPFRGGIGYLITGHEEVKGTELRSWYLLANVSNSKIGHIAALIAMRMPDGPSRVYPDKIVRAALATVSFRTPPLAELLRLLPFKTNKMAGFRVLRIAPQGVLVLIDGPSNDLAKRPYMIVQIGRGAPGAPDLRPNFARDLLMRSPLSALAITSGEAMRINGGQGYELRAKAEGAGGAPLALVQWLRFGSGSSFLRVIGVVDKDRWDEMFPRFRAVRDGIDAR
jgi:hypothetical protein